jgi:hypothetical protein
MVHKRVVTLQESWSAFSCTTPVTRPSNKVLTLIPQLRLNLIFPMVGRDRWARRVCDVTMPIDRFTRRLNPTLGSKTLILCSLCFLWPTQLRIKAFNATWTNYQKVFVSMVGRGLRTRRFLGLAKLLTSACPEAPTYRSH